MKPADLLSDSQRATFAADCAALLNRLPPLTGDAARVAHRLSVAVDMLNAALDALRAVDRADTYMHERGEALAKVRAVLADTASAPVEATPSPTYRPGVYRVRATRDHTVGPTREIAVNEGAIRTVNVDTEGRFTTTTNGGSFYGVCQIGQGWELAP